VKREQEVIGLRGEAARLRGEAERLQREAREAERASRDAAHRLNMDVRHAIEVEHGAVVGKSGTCYLIDPEVHKSLAEIHDPVRRREAELAVVGRCEWCEVELYRPSASKVEAEVREGDIRELMLTHMSGKWRSPSAKCPTICAWCWEHKGKTHCWDC